MKRVVHLLGPSGGGIRRHVRYLAAHPPPGWETAWIGGPADLASWFAPLPFVPLGGVRRLLAARRDVDLVHTHGLTAGMRTLVPAGPPVVLTVHLILGLGGRTGRSRTAAALARLVVRRARAVIAVSEAAAAGIPGAVVIAPAVDLPGPPRRSRADVRAHLGTDRDAVVAVTVARLHRDKALGTFVRAVSAAGLTGWIVGEGPERAALERAARGTDVHLLGYRDDVSDLLGAADVFVLTSSGEGYGIAVMEAIAAGLPVVAGRTGAIGALAGDAAILVDPGDAGAVTRALTRLATDPSEPARLAAAARGRPLPDPSALVAAVGRVYDEVTR